MKCLVLDAMIPVMKPLLPNTEAISRYLREIDQSRVYSNFGPLTQRLIARLSSYFNVEADNIALLTNGTLGIQGAVATASKPLTEWAVPDWTFVATAQAVLSAGCMPYLLDVGLEDWTLPKSDGRATEGTIVTAPFGSGMNLADWGPESMKRPVVIDAASCFDSFRDLSLVNRLNICVMVSLHATKLVSTGEGGVVIGPKAWIAEIKTWSNFGFFGDRIARQMGTNAKLSEYSAAVGLASLDEWSSTRERWHALFRHYSARLLDIGIDIETRLNGPFVTSTMVAKMENAQSKLQTVVKLNNRNIETRDWWGSGLHRMPALAKFSRGLTFTNSHSLGTSTIGLPIFVGMTPTEVDLVVDTMIHG